MSFTGKHYWIVGASEGLGRSLAKALAARGARLTLSARTADRLEALASELPAGAAVVPFDVMDSEAVKSAAAQVSEPDGVIYCVGLYNPMPAQKWDSAAVLKIADANYMGALRVLGEIVPGFVEKDAGHIVLIGSLAGFRGLPGATGYGSSKAAMMHAAENLRVDLWRTGVKVQLANPGYIRTRLTDQNDFTMPFLMEPEEAADHVIRAMESDRFQTNFPRVFSWLFRAAQFLPAPLYYRIFG